MRRVPQRGISPAQLQKRKHLNFIPFQCKHVMQHSPLTDFQLYYDGVGTPFMHKKHVCEQLLKLTQEKDNTFCKLQAIRVAHYNASSHRELTFTSLRPNDSSKG